MAPRISLALAIHNHQPVGNFGWVFAEVFETAYQPMVEALERHPTSACRSTTRARCSNGSGRSGPSSSSVCGPSSPATRSRSSAAATTNRSSPRCRSATGSASSAGWGRELEATFGRRPSGAWLAERVWEPDLPTSLVDGGYDWTILDDAHFRAAAIPEERLWGPYTTDDQGSRLPVFGTEQGLRYRIPFRDGRRGHRLPARPRHRGRRAGRDDGRRRREVRRLADDLGALLGRRPLGRPVLRGARGERRLADHDHAVDVARPTTCPIGRVYVPTGSYAEMGEWALPPDERLLFHASSSDAKDRDLPEARWLRGAFWRNFQVKYREINDLHKQMLRTSGAVDAMAAGPERARALDHLYHGQSNDCYWHGLFGGDLHRPHAPRDVRPPHRRRGPRRHRRRPARVGRDRRPRPRRPATRSSWPGPARSSRST